MRRRVFPGPALLTPDRFKTSPDADGQHCHALQTGSHIKLARGQIKEGTLRQVYLIIEQKRKIDTGIAELKEIASCLTRQSTSDYAPKGILRCLGYREHPQLELISELPSGCGPLQTLETLIRTDANQGYAGHRPLDYRYRLALQISEAVLSVHTSSRVHKNIRPDTILMVKVQDDSISDDLDFGMPYLTDWIKLRNIDAPSSMVGENDWLRDIYRHPRRQGLQPEARYNMGHDVYSLGVCLLTVRLWESLITVDNEVKFPGKEYRETAIGLDLTRA